MGNATDQHAEALGFVVVWASEAYGSDSSTVLAWLAAQTSRGSMSGPRWMQPSPNPGGDSDDCRQP